MAHPETGPQPELVPTRVPVPDSYDQAAPIFGRTGRTFHPLHRLCEVSVNGEEVLLKLATRDGVCVAGRLSFPAADVVRFQWSFGTPPGPRSTEMLAGPVPTLPVQLTESDGEVSISAGGPPVVLARQPWRLRFGPYRTEPADTSLVSHVNEAGGWAAEDGRVSAYETFALAPGEQLYGLGERFLGPRLRGRRLAHWIDEAFGTNTTDRVYKSVPLLLSSRGYGVFVHHSEEAVFDIGAYSVAAATFLVDAPELDVFVFLGSPKKVLAGYTALTGRPPVPPEWSFGTWMSKCMYANRDEVAEVLVTARRHDIPVDVVGLDPLWLRGRAGEPVDTCDFVWNSEAFGEPHEFTGWLHEQGVRLCLWVNPHLGENKESFLAYRLVGRGRTRDPYFPGRGFVDFTGEGGRWWRKELRRLLDEGVDAFKLDYGELLPADAQLDDGRTGRDVHNLYPLLASALAYEAGAPVCFTRSGTAGSQRYPLHWSGDAQSTWAGLAGCLRGGLAAAWSGFAFWTCDIGGFFLRDVTAGPEHPTFGFSRPEAELYIRWLQFGHLLSHTRYHGTQGREPWLFGEEAVRAAQQFGRLRRRLRGYLLDAAGEAAQTGCPVMRPLAMEFPDDPGAREVDTGYLLGPDLLVYPVLEPGGRVEVYLPPGSWQDHFTGERSDGPGWHELRVGLDRLPLYVRSGARPFSE